jgi:hypothetical protein
MVSALCVVFASAGLSRPAAAQVNPPMNPGLQSIQARPTTAQSDLQPRAKLPDLQSPQTWERLRTSPGAHPEWLPHSWLMPSQDAAIDSTLAALKQEGASQSRLGQQLAHAMMGLTDKDDRPPWPLVNTFADNLTHELVGKQLTSAQNTALRECLSEAVRRTGTSNARLASRLQEILTAAGLKPSRTQIIISDFVKLRESVQGPDDLPVRIRPVKN